MIQYNNIIDHYLNVFPEKETDKDNYHFSLFIIPDGGCARPFCSQGAATDGLICSPALSDFEATIDVLREALEAATEGMLDERFGMG